MSYTMAELNQMTQAEFVTAIGAVYEQTPAIAAAAWSHAPFNSVDVLQQTLVAIVQAMHLDAQLQLICAHPDLGSKAKMAEASVQEQAGVGLDRLTPDEYDRFHQLNQAYRDQFGFPFIIAVKNHTKESILLAFEQRLQHDRQTEMNQALQEIHQIARFRLHSLID